MGGGALTRSNMADMEDDENLAAVGSFCDTDPPHMQPPSTSANEETPSTMRRMPTTTIRKPTVQGGFTTTTTNTKIKKRPEDPG